MRRASSSHRDALFWLLCVPSLPVPRPSRHGCSVTQSVSNLALTGARGSLSPLHTPPRIDASSLYAVTCSRFFFVFFLFVIVIITPLVFWS